MNSKRIGTLLLILLLLIFTMIAAGSAEESAEFVDYVSQLHLNMHSATLKTTATVKAFVDGDTVHFYVPTSISESGSVKVRFLALNTPESTGKIEEYGIKASNFTREKLEGAVSIILEADSNEMEIDSTGERYLFWVWYQPAEGEEYRNLNLELLQNGLAKAYSTFNTQYGSICSNALDQARQFKLNMYSGEADPDYYYGNAIEITLKELRCHAEKYLNKKVAFSGIVTLTHNQSAYVEAYDADSELVYGISVYYGYSLSGKGLSILTPGNQVRVVGTVQYYEAADQYQVSDVSYRQMKPSDPNNLQLINEGQSPYYTAVSLDKLLNDTVTIVDEENGAETYDYAQLAQYTSVSVDGLKVTAASSTGSVIYLTCSCGDQQITVETPYNEEMLTLIEHTINVRGFVERDYDGNVIVCTYLQDAITLQD